MLRRFALPASPTKNGEHTVHLLLSVTYVGLSLARPPGFCTRCSEWKFGFLPAYPPIIIIGVIAKSLDSDTSKRYYSREFARLRRNSRNVGTPMHASAFPFAGHKNPFSAILHVSGKDGVACYKDAACHGEIAREKLETIALCCRPQTTIACNGSDGRKFRR